MRAAIAAAMSVLTIVVAGGTILQWQIEAINRRLNDRSLTFTRQMDDMSACLRFIEQKQCK